MKISKLFHWLYAFLMALPIAFLLPNVLYYAFNEHATNSQIEETNIVYKYETTEVNSVEDLILGNVYYCKLYDLAYYTDYDELDFYTHYLAFSNIDNENINYIFENTQVFNIYDFRLEVNQLIFECDFYGPATNFVLTEVKENDYICFQHLEDNQYPSQIYEYMQECPQEYIPIESVTTRSESLGIVGSIEKNINDTFNLPLFSWSKNSFLAQPFNYIMNLFGIPSNNVFVYYLDYWLSISIIWLVFDLIMYLPLLVHRWIDKGVIE